MIKLILPILLYVAMAEASLKVTSSSRDARHPTAMEVEVQLPQSDGTVRIPLLRNDEYENMPVLVKNKGSVRTFSARQVHHSSHAHYSDIQSKSVMSVREVNGEKRFAGHFTHEGRTYFVEPQARGHNITAEPITADQQQQYRKLQKMKKQVMESVSRRKRQTDTSSTTDVIEIGVCIDSTVFSFFNEKFQESALTEIHFYYTHIMNGVNVAFRNIQSMSIGVRAISLTISTTAADDSWMPAAGSADRQSGDAILTVMQSYKGSLSPQPDHLMAFTREDIHGSGSFSVVGMATLSGVCKDYGVSINEDGGLHSWGTAAHELAHNMGSGHDGDSNTCDSSQKLLMSPSGGIFTLSTVANSYQFSSCSIDQMSNYVNGLGSSSCLRSAVGNALGDLAQQGKAGARYSLDQVCQLAMPSSLGKFMVTSDAAANPAVICASIFCKTSETGGSTRGGLRAPVGSSCGDKKSCDWTGQCSDDPNAPSADESCFFGDKYDTAYCQSVLPYVSSEQGKAANCGFMKSYCCHTAKAACAGY